MTAYIAGFVFVLAGFVGVLLFAFLVVVLLVSGISFVVKVSSSKRPRPYHLTVMARPATMRSQM